MDYWLEMRPFLKSSFTIGATIEFSRPPIPPSKEHLLPLVFKLTEQGWERIAGKRPSHLTPLAAWVIGDLIVLRLYAHHHATDGPQADDVNHDLQVMLVIACFLAGLILWALDWSQYKKSLK